MRRQLSPSNPLADIPRFAFGFEFIRNGMRVLDYGCFEGAFGRLLHPHVAVEYYGVDKNPEAVRRGAHDLRLQVLESALPFTGGFFDVVVIFEVLEHIHDQKKVLKEIHRVLKPGGTLIVSVPKRYVLSFLDPANYKFRFPRLHRLYYSLTHSREAYELRYAERPGALVGDIESEKSWHQHFRDAELKQLLEACGFQVDELDGAGLFSMLFDSVGLIMGWGKHVPARVRQWDDYRFHSRGLLCRSHKI
jgi:SAM-dependent methyltransferase